MADSVRATQQGLQIVEKARRQKKWNKTAEVWCSKAFTSRATLNRFWAGQPIRRTTFMAICDAVGVNWEEIVEKSDRPVPLVPVATTGASKPDPSFVGREGAIAHLNTLVNQGAKVILIQAKGGVGKTKLASEYLKSFDLVLTLWMAKEQENITSAASLVEEWLRRYFNQEPGREFGITLERLRQQLQGSTTRIGVLIDNLETALDSNGKFIAPHRSYVELLRLLATPDVQSLTLVTSRESLREAAVTATYYHLEGLDIAAWQEFFHCHHIQTSTVLNAMHQAYGGNAKAMSILLGATQEDYSGDLEAYWQAIGGDLLIEGDLRDLVNSQFNRLQQIDLKAFKLLCRLGCYRFSNLPTVPIEGLLCLLWDVPPGQRRRVVKSLQDRSLVEFKSGEYWLHPVIKVEAVARSRTGEDWETANREAAEFWTSSVKRIETVEDALGALEAYYHYFEIGDFEQAGIVIKAERDNQWGYSESLDRSFDRLGILHQMTTLINRIIAKIKPGYFRAALYDSLGDCYWMTGELRKAIECYEETGKIAIVSLESLPNNGDSNKIKLNLEELKIGTTLHIGSCRLELWELEEAGEIFQEVSSIAENKQELYVYAVYAWCGLAFVKSCLQMKEEAEKLVEKVFDQLSQIRFTWGTGHTLLLLGSTFKNLGEIEKSFEMYRRAIDYACERHYPQVRAKALSGLAELYREQGDFETGIPNHLEAVELMDKIGAKSDLAEAYYQLGLTYKKMDETQKSQEKFQASIQLFKKIEAPLQAEKVQQVMR